MTDFRRRARLLGRAAYVSLVLGLCHGTIADAQIPEAGTRIRLSRADAVRLVGTFNRIEGDTLWINWGSRAELPVRLTEIQRLDVSGGGTTWVWTRRAIALGAVLGMVTCVFDDCREGTESRASSVVQGGIWLGAGFGIFGVIGGAVLGGEGWRTIPVPVAVPTSR